MPEIKSIFDVIKNDDSLSKFRDSIQQADVVAEFYDVFPDLRKIARPVKIEKNILYLSVVNSVWKSELKFKQKIIIDKINKHFEREILKNVRFT